MDPRRLIPVTLVALALGIGLSPAASAQAPAGARPITAVTERDAGPRGAAPQTLPAARALLPGLGSELTTRSRTGALRPSSAADPAAGQPSRYIAVRTMGRARNESGDPLRQRFTFPLYSLVDGSVVGNATDDIACSQTTPPPCAVIDAITTFRFTQGLFPLGTIVNRAQVSIAPDVQRPGFVIVGARSSQPTIQTTTGAYAGHSGIVVLSGSNDIRSFPNELTQDDLWLIQLQ
jgi:hypothetical protein